MPLQRHRHQCRQRRRIKTIVAPVVVVVARVAAAAATVAAVVVRNLNGISATGLTLIAINNHYSSSSINGGGNVQHAAC